MAEIIIVVLLLRLSHFNKKVAAALISMDIRKKPEHMNMNSLTSCY